MSSRIDPRWKRVKEVFFGAEELSGEAQAAWLDAECEGDKGLRNEVERLLRCANEPASWLDRPEGLVGGFLERLAGEVEEPELPEEIGGYRIVRKLGSGGMGVVYLGEREKGDFLQQVAIKVARVHSGDRHRLKRFEVERQLLASLRHPNIAHLYDGGVTPDGKPYMVMEYVDGCRIDRWCDERRAGVRERIRLLISVCEAVSYAHSRGVIHRDLKPSNILVSEDGFVKVVDFGIAKLVGGFPGVEDPERTTTGVSPMTPLYSSPEQVMGGKATERTDVYLLGILLFILLTGKHPREALGPIDAGLSISLCPSDHYRKTSRRPLVNGMARSATSADQAYLRSSKRHQLRKMLSGDIDAVAAHALRNHPDERYQSVQGLAHDLNAFLLGYRTIVRVNHFRYWTKYYLGTRRIQPIALTTLLIVAIFATGKSTISKIKDLETEENATSLALSIDLLRLLDLQHQEAIHLRNGSLLDSATSELKKRLAKQPVHLARHLGEIGRLYHNNGLPGKALSVIGQASDIHRLKGSVKTLEYADLLFQSGSIQLDLLMLDEAEMNHRRALEIRQVALGEQSAMVALSYAAMSRVHRARGRIVDAEMEAQKAVERIVALNGNTDPDVILCKDHLAIVYRESGRLAEADSLFRENLRLRNEVGQSSLRYLADNLNNLALVLDDRFLVTGDRKLLLEADTLMEQATAVARMRLRQGHPIAANVLHGRGVVNARLLRYDRAEALIREALHIYREYVDADHPALPGVMSDLGFILRENGMIDEGVSMHQEAFELSRRMHGEVNLSTGNFAYELSVALKGIANEEALLYGNTALETFIQILKEGDESIVKARMQVARLEIALGRLDRAEQMLRKVLAEREATLDAGDWRIGSTQSILGECLMLQGNYQEAGYLLQRGYDTMKASRGNDDMKVVEAAKRLHEYRKRHRTQLQNV